MATTKKDKIKSYLLYAVYSVTVIAGSFGLDYVKSNRLNGMWLQDELAQSIPAEILSTLNASNFSSLHVTKMQSNEERVVLFSDCDDDTCTITQNALKKSRPTEDTYIVRLNEDNSIQVFASGIYLDEEAFVASLKANKFTITREY